MNKVIIQIPAFNEEDTIALTLSQLPRELPGIDSVEWLLIDDGSADKTCEIASQNGIDHIVSLPYNQGLAKAFITGIEACLERGATIIVNTDADNQYCADDIVKLIEPILAKKAEIVIGARPIQTTSHFSASKKLLQKLGSYVMKKISNADCTDAPSGFRAISRTAALQLNIFNEYTYTLEMLIQAGKKGIPLCSVPIRTNKDERPSRLMKSIPSYIKKSVITMIRIFNTYKPLHFFITLGVIPTIAGIGLGLRWVILFMGKGQGLHLPSLILAAILLLLGSQLIIFGFIADLISVNRKLLEDIQLKNRTASLKES